MVGVNAVRQKGKSMGETNTLNRRSFLRHGSALLALPVLGLSALQLSSCTKNGLSITGTGLTDKSRPDVAWKLVMASEKEPGEPLVISGIIYTPDGRTPLEGINLWVYHTDATGHYSSLSASGGDNRNTRLHGRMRTNAEGRYEFRSIKPAPYPGRTNPAHIHAFVSGPGYPEYWIDEYLFEGDPFITEEMRRKASGQGTFSSILKLARGQDGVLRGVRDIKIELCANNCTGR